MGDGLRRIVILGSTGSIGRQALEVVRLLPSRFQVVGLAAGRQTALLRNQIEEFRPRMVYSPFPLGSIASGRFTSMEEMASDPDVDLVLVGTSGKAGLSPLLCALQTGKHVAVANKEALVMAGHILTTEARRSGASILPVDSEHSAVWQCLRGEQSSVSRLYITASGGPFYHSTWAELEGVTPEQALGHPVWEMGKKITVDSATLMNKGLEVIEAHWLFDVPFEHIEVLVHPQCIIHSMVEFADGSLKAQLSVPDMKLPIQYALSYPERVPNSELSRVDFTAVRSLTIERLDAARFPCFALAVDAARQGATYPTVLCAADEVAVEHFLARRIRLTDIAAVVEATLLAHEPVEQPALDDILAADIWARRYAAEMVGCVRERRSVRE